MFCEGNTNMRLYFFLDVSPWQRIDERLMVSKHETRGICDEKLLDWFNMRCAVKKMFSI